MILEQPPIDPRKTWSQWFFKIYQVLNFLQLPILTTSNRGLPGNKGRLIFNLYTNRLNYDDGTQWVELSASTGVGSVTDDGNGVVVVDNTDPLNPIITFEGVNVDGVTITGDGTSGNPLTAITSGVTGTGVSGQVAFWTGTSTVSGSSNLFWDNTNSRLGIGTNSPSAPIHLIKDSIGITSTDGLILSNTTAATNVLNQYSPRLRFIGQGWKTNATAGSQQVEWLLENQPITGTTNPTGSFWLYTNINGAGLQEQARFTQGPGTDRATFTIGSILSDKTISIANGNGLTCTGPINFGNLTSTSTISGIVTSNSFTTSTLTSRYLFAGATEVNFNFILGGSSSRTPFANNSAANFVFGQIDITKNATGTHALFANGVFRPLTVTTGASSLTNTATVYIEDASSATVTGANLALWVDAGISRLDGNVSIATNGVPTAKLHLGAGSATAGTAPFKLTAGTVLTTPEAGAIEFDGTHYYGTIGSTRYQLDQQGGGGGTVISVTDDGNTVVTVDNTDPTNPIIEFNGVVVDNVTITGSGQVGDPLIASSSPNLDGGEADTNYGGMTAINGGTA